MKRISLALLLLSGCLSNDSLGTWAMAESNISNLSRISIGMSEAEVMSIMHKPYSKETIQYQEETFDFWFYITRPTGLDQGRLMPQNLTPLTFKNGILIAWGFNYYNYIAKKDKLSQSESNKAPEEEDVNLEKALEAPPSKGKVPAQKPSKQVTPAPQSKSLPKATPKEAAPNPGTPPPKPQPLELGPPPQTPKPTTSFSVSRLFAQSDEPIQKGEKEKEEKKAKPPKKEKPPLSDEDRRMIQEENQENFDFW